MSQSVCSCRRVVRRRASPLRRCTIRPVTAATVVRTNAPRQPETGYAGGPDERERKGLGRRHRDEDHGELPAPGGDGEPEDGEEEEPAEAGRRSAGGFPEERGERDVADRDARVANRGTTPQKRVSASSAALSAAAKDTTR